MEFLIVGTYMHDIIPRNTRSKYIKWKKYYISFVTRLLSKYKKKKKTDDKNKKPDYT